jgi:hypothetical protein
MKLIETKGVTDVVITSPIVKKRVGYIVVR